MSRLSGVNSDNCHALDAFMDIYWPTSVQHVTTCTNKLQTFAFINITGGKHRNKFLLVLITELLYQTHQFST